MARRLDPKVRGVFLLTLLALLLLLGRAVVYSEFPFPYRQDVVRAAHTWGLDPRLVAAVIRAESHWNPRAVSRKGAVGLMQLLPTTAAWVAGQLHMKRPAQEELLQPAVNIHLGTWYLAYLVREFPHDLVAALAAYNAGKNNVRRWQEHGRWQAGAGDLQAIPFPETRQFVRRVVLLYRIYRYLYPAP